MNNFIPPIIGEKIGEFKLSWQKEISTGCSGPVLFVFDYLVWRLGVLIILPVSFGVNFIKTPFNPEWASWMVGLLLCLWGVISAILGIYNFSNSKERKTAIISGSSFSLFLINNGVEINDNKIPFKTTNLLSKNFSPDGIVLFKLDGDYLFIKTEGEPFINVSYELNENQMKFKIDSKYQFYKNELLSYLNNLIKENNEDLIGIENNDKKLNRKSNLSGFAKCDIGHFYRETLDECPYCKTEM